MIDLQELENRLSDIEEERELERTGTPQVHQLRFERVHILNDDVLLNRVSLEAREVHLEAVRAALGKPSNSFLTLMDLEELPGVTHAAVKELEGVGLFTPVWLSRLGTPAGYTLPLVSVLCGYERHEEMPWHPEFKAVTDED